MKIFIYKTIIFFFLATIFFEITIGYRITKYKNEIYQLIHKENLNKIINKIREEIRAGNKKDKYFTDEDREILSTFIYKLNNELSKKK